MQDVILKIKNFGTKKGKLQRELAAQRSDYFLDLKKRLQQNKKGSRAVARNSLYIHVASPTGFEPVLPT